MAEDEAVVKRGATVRDVAWIASAAVADCSATRAEGPAVGRVAASAGRELGMDGAEGLIGGFVAR